jgi:hypothetical protein
VNVALFSEELRKVVKCQSNLKYGGFKNRILKKEFLANLAICWKLLN